MDTPDLVSGGLGALAGGLVTQLGNWLTKRTEKAPDLQETLNAAVAGVVRHYTEALRRSDGEATALRGEVAEMRRLVEELTLRIEDQSARIAEQSGEIDGLASHVASLERMITDLGGTPPPRRAKRAAAKSKTELGGCA